MGLVFFIQKGDRNHEALSAIIIRHIEGTEVRPRRSEQPGSRQPPAGARPQPPQGGREGQPADPLPQATGRPDDHRAAGGGAGVGHHRRLRWGVPGRCVHHPVCGDPQQRAGRCAGEQGGGRHRRAEKHDRRHVEGHAGRTADGGAFRRAGARRRDSRGSRRCGTS